MMSIRIIDKTLSCLDSLDALPKNKPALLRFLNLLIKMEVDAIELSQKMRELLSPLPDYPAYIIADQDDKTNINRMNGYDDAMCGDYQHTFAQLRNSYGDRVEFCPGNGDYCATALAVEWVICGGENVVTTFGGIGETACSQFAATEEVVMALRTKGLRKPEKIYDFFPEMTELFYRIKGQTKVNNSGITNKPVVGKNIFYVESGVHVDGIMKQPKCYEPFPPEVVGQKRKILLGKQSGRASIRIKLEKLGINCKEECYPLILEQVKVRAEKMNRAITDQEFSKIVTECQI